MLTGLSKIYIGKLTLTDYGKRWKLRRWRHRSIQVMCTAMTQQLHGGGGVRARGGRSILTGHAQLQLLHGGDHVPLLNPAADDLLRLRRHLTRGEWRSRGQSSNPCNQRAHAGAAPVKIHTRGETGENVSFNSYLFSGILESAICVGHLALKERKGKKSVTLVNECRAPCCDCSPLWSDHGSWGTERRTERQKFKLNLQQELKLLQRGGLSCTVIASDSSLQQILWQTSQIRAGFFNLARPSGSVKQFKSTTQLTTGPFLITSLGSICLPLCGTERQQQFLVIKHSLWLNMSAGSLINGRMRRPLPSWGCRCGGQSDLRLSHIPSNSLGHRNKEAHFWLLKISFISRQKVPSDLSDAESAPLLSEYPLCNPCPTTTPSELDPGTV